MSLDAPQKSAPARGTSALAGPEPAVVAIDMGYGHLRTAHALATHLGTRVLLADAPPLASPDEEVSFLRIRQVYETVSRLSSVPLVGRPFRALLDSVTVIPRLHPRRDLSRATLAVELLALAARRGLGRTMVAELARDGRPLIATFYSAAILADAAGYERIYCVVTDSDVQRIWAPRDPARTRINYLAPTERVVRRLRAYGVPDARIHFTGFPLPPSLLGGPALPVLRHNLSLRLARLDPSASFRASRAPALAELGPPTARDAGPAQLTFAVGGAGAQAELAGAFLPSLARLISEGRLEVCLVAGVRPDVAHTFEQAVSKAGLGSALGRSVRVLMEEDRTRYFERFEATLARTDVLWTKPSELTFYAALGLPLILSPAVGRHENYNARWVIENGAGLRQRDPRCAGEWIEEWLADGTLAAAAFAGYERLPNRGLYRIEEVLGGDSPRRPDAPATSDL